MVFYESDVEIFMRGAPLGFAERYAGDHAWHDLFREFHEHFAEPRWTIRRVVDGGDRIAAEIGFLGRGKSSGVRVERSVGTAYYFSPRGKVVRQEIFWDGWDLALEAVGLSE